MKTAKLFQHGGSQAVRLPKAFRFDGSEVLIEKHGSDVLLKPLTTPRFQSFAELGNYLSDAFPGPDEFPSPPERPKEHERQVVVLEPVRPKRKAR